MKTIALKGDLRNDLGSRNTKQLRAKGLVPCVVYGNGDNVHFSVYESDFKNLVYTPNSYLVRLDIDGNQKMAKLQDMQFHPVSEAITHADFLEITVDSPIKVRVPIHITGNSPGVREGGKLNVKIRKLLVEGMIQDLPDSIEVNVDSLELGKNIRVRDIDAGNLKMLDTPENSVVSVNVTRASKSAMDGELEAGAEEGAEGESTPEA